MIIDEAGIVICGVYVELNMIHAGAAESVATSTHTSAYRRLTAWKARQSNNAKDADCDDYLCPIHVDGDGQGGDPPAGQIGSSRASDKGVLEMTLEKYFEVLDWASRQARRDKACKVADDAPPILEQVGLKGSTLMAFVEGFEELFHLAVGKLSSLKAFGAKLNRNWLQGAKGVAAVEGEEEDEK